MAVGNSEGGDETLCDMNTTPLIDVMLVLLVMLIVTIPIQTHAVKLDLPPPTNTPPPPPDQQPVVINLEVDFDGTPVALSWISISPASRRKFRSRKCI
jgi:biopolymer transport protein ExbD